MGLHPHHDENQEESIAEFVNKYSTGVLDDLNADTVQTYALMDDALLLAFVDLEMWDKNQTEAAF